MAFVAHLFASIALFFQALFGHAPAVSVPSEYATTTKGYISFNNQVVQGADVDTFKPLTTPQHGPTDYAIDKNHVYLGTAIVQGADPKTFVVLSGPLYDPVDKIQYNYAKDANHVFLNDLVISQADPKTFVVVKGSATLDAKDKNHSYLYGSVVQ